ncbi:MAG: permease [Bacillus sp. (in: Bacteria)]|nr:permease [Bacillus sp. (in: firmicutes)]
MMTFLSISIELTVLFVGVSFLMYLIQGVIPYKKMEKWLKNNHSIFGALIAVLFAFITPFCSCSTIPIVVHLLNQKIRFAIVMIFLFASPVLDPTILTLMAATLGLKVAVAYAIITALFSILIGFALEILGFEKEVKNVIVKGKAKLPERLHFRAALHETSQLMKSVYPFLLIGAAIGSLIHEVVPTEWLITYLGGEQWWLVPIAAIIGIPLYIRLSTMIPISHMLISKGMAIAPVMALMISSAGASLPEVTLLQSIFKKKLVLAFVVSVITMSTLSGWLFYVI